MSINVRTWSSRCALGLIVILAFGCASPAAPAPTQAPAPKTGQAAAPAAVSTSQPAAPATTQQVAPAPAPTPTAVPVPTGELRIGVADLGTEALDPMLASISGAFYMPLIFDHLVGTTYDGKLSKDTGLAADWQQSADGLTWTFKLRKGVKFQNGNEATGEDVKFSLERAISPKSRVGYVSTGREVVDTITVPDPYTVIIKTKYPYGNLPFLLSKLMGSQLGAVEPKSYIQQIGDDQFGVRPIGSGPYKVADHKTGTKLVLETVPSHWRVGVPKYKTITFTIIGEPTTMIAALKKGEQDIVSVPISLLKEVSGYYIGEKKGAVPIGLHVDQQWEDVPYKDVRVRQALAEAIDRKAINETLAGGLADMNYIGPIAGSDWALGYPKLAEIPYNPDHAKQLLKDAGYPQGFDINFFSLPRPGGYDLAKMAEMIVEYWRAIGVKAAIKKTDYATLKPMWQGFKMPNSVWLNASQGFAMADAVLRTTFHSDGASSGAHDPKLDALIVATEQSKTMDDYAKNQGAVLQNIRDNYNSIGIITGGEYFATSPALKGWNPGKMTTFHDFDSLITR